MTQANVKLGLKVFGLNVASPTKTVNGTKYKNFLVGDIVYIDIRGRWVTVDCGDYRSAFFIKDINPYTDTLPMIRATA